MLKEKVHYSEFPHLTHKHMELLLKCFSVCSSCAKKCMNEGMSETAVLCSDCADICSLAIKLHSGDSQFSEQTFALCAEACERCAQACKNGHTEHCHQCADICKKCAEGCREE